MIEASRVKAIFLEAVEVASGPERSAFLAKACAGDPEVRRRVESLMRAHDDTDSVLDRPAAEQFFPTECTVLDIAQPEPTQVALLPSSRPGSLGKLAHYEMLEVLGQGGFGTVYKSFDEKLHRVIAIKVLTPTLGTSGNARQRFLREARAAAAVRDEHVINIHAVEEQPLPYLVMEYVHGPTLQQKLDKTGPLPVKEILRIGYQTAAGLAAAHKQGLIHRDIKPANILLENGVERVKLSDFGLARAVDDASLTQSGVLAGTPMYMSPEQAQGESVDYRSDLFSLGSVLYALCTGRSPFRGDSALAVLKRVCEDTPHAIREINPDIPDWLVNIVNRLLAKAPEDRFQSAKEVADLLASHLSKLQGNGQLPAAERVTQVAPATSRRPVWRSPALVGSALVAIAGVIVLAIIFRGQWLGSRSESGSSGQEDKSSSIQLSNPLDRLARANLPRRSLTLAGAGDPDRAPPEVIGVIGVGQFDIPPKSRLGWFAQSNDGKVLAVPANRQIALINAVDGVPLGKLSTPYRIYRVAFSPDDKHLVGACDGFPDGGGDYQIGVWDLETKHEIAQLHGPNTWIAGLAYSPIGTRVAASAYDDTHVYLWDAETGKLLDQLSSEDVKGEFVTFDPSGKYLACQGTTGGVVWNVSSRQVMHSWKTAGAGVGGCAYSADGKWLAACDGDNITVWNAEDFKVQRSFATPDRRWLALSPDGKLLLSARHDIHGGVGSPVHRWDLTTGKELDSIATGAHGEWLFCQLSPDGKVLFAAGDDDEHLRRFNTITGQPFPADQAHVGPVRAVAFSRDGQRLASGGEDRSVKLWDLAKWREGEDLPPVRTLLGHAAIVDSVKFSPDGKVLASGSSDRTIMLWDVESGKRVRTLKGFAKNAMQIDFSANGEIIAAGQEDGTVKFWNVASGNPMPELPGHTGEVRSVAYSPDGKLMASGGADKTVRVYDAESDELVRSFELPHPVNRVAFSPDSKLLGATTDDESASVLCLWETRTWSQRTWPVHTGNVRGLTFSAAAPLAATSGTDGVVRFWDLQATSPHALVVGSGWREGAIDDIAFTPDGRYLAIAGPTGTVTIVRSPSAPPAYKPGPTIDVPTTADLAKKESAADALDPDSIPKALLTQANVDGKPPAGLVAILGGKDGHQGQVFGVAIRPDGKVLASAGQDRTVRLWDLAKGTLSHTLSVAPLGYCVDFSPDNKVLASGDGAGTIKLWDAESGEALRTLSGHRNRVTAVVFSPDGKLLASTGDDGSVRVWDAETGKARRLFDAGTEAAWSVAFSRDGKTLASGHHGVIKLWDLDTGWQVGSLEGHTSDWVRTLVFSPDGRLLASSSQDTNDPIRLWDVAELRSVEQLSGHTSSVIAACWDSAATTLVTIGDTDGSVRLWDTTVHPPRCKVLQVLPAGRRWLNGVALTPEGRYVATANPDGTVYILKVAESAR